MEIRENMTNIVHFMELFAVVTFHKVIANTELGNIEQLFLRRKYGLGSC